MDIGGDDPEVLAFFEDSIQLFTVTNAVRVFVVQGDLARHAFDQVGAYDGPTIFLYNEYANGIRHREQLDRVLDESEDLWIVPADAHF